ncbi:MAG: MOSC domain-containing protein [Acidimicrobiia bacterium]|jgi:MOSC domain-containing protein YiiM
MRRNTAELETFLDNILGAPAGTGRLEMIVRRPADGERDVVENGQLSLDEGLVGDNWKARGNAHMEDGAADPQAQVTLMNSRATEAVAMTRDRWALCGDQLYVDFDLSLDNLPPGSRLAVGDAVVEISAKPHTGCAKFSKRFGAEALRFVNVGIGRENRFRGVNTLVIQAGAVAVGNKIAKLDPA